MDESEIPEDDLRVERAEPQEQIPRSGMFEGDRVGYPVNLVLSRDALLAEEKYLEEKLGGRIDVNGSIVTIHDTTIEEIKANSASIAERVRDASRVAREADRQRIAENRERGEALEAERKRRQDIANEIKFE